MTYYNIDRGSKIGHKSPEQSRIVGQHETQTGWRRGENIR